jgi:tetratricopeptide (TPR) repeat protein
VEEVPADPGDQVSRFFDEGDEFLNDGRHDEAIALYQAAWDLLPEPRTDHPDAMLVLAVIGDVHFFRGEFAAGRDAFMTCMKCPEGEPTANPFLRLRLGQCMYELGETVEAANWLAGAYLLEGKELCSQDDPKYLEFIKSRLEPPPGGWPEGW